MKKSFRRGVTLLELILVIAIIAILFAVIFVSLDPGRRLNEANNSARRIAAASVADAIAKQRLDNAGNYYTTVDAHVDSLATAGGGGGALVLTSGQYYYAMIGTNTSTCSKSTTLADVCDNTVGTDTCIDLSGIGANYLTEVPIDPDATNTSRDATQTGYYFGVGSENELVVGSCDAAGEDAGGAGTAETIQIFR